MPKKIKKTTFVLAKPRTSAKQKFAEYQNSARVFINKLLYPATQTIFTIESYTQDKKPNFAAIPELLAIVGTAQKLGKKVQVRISGVNVLEFVFVDQLNFPAEL